MRNYTQNISSKIVSLMQVNYYQILKNEIFKIYSRYIIYFCKKIIN